MTKLHNVLSLVGIVAAQGCSSAPVVEEVAHSRAAVVGSQATITITSNNGTIYCATATVPNPLSTATNVWKIIFDIEATTISSVTGANLSATSHLITATPNGTTMIAPGTSATFSFCANTQNVTPYPTVIAWNMEPAGYAQCQTNTGLLPTKASLAVAMAKELRRWIPLQDLAIDGTTGWVALSSAGVARCNANGGCPNTLALLGQQEPGLANVVNQNVFNPVTYKEDLIASLNRQSTLIQNLILNNPGALPPAHLLTAVGGPTNLGMGSCGPHYIFQVDNLDGTPLSPTQAANMTNSLCFFGYGSCGNNPYLGFTQTGVDCPSGRTCVAIDPTDGDNGTTATMSAGMVPTYPGDRVYDEDRALVGTLCMTTSGGLASLVNKCSELPSTCGYDYCVWDDYYPCNIGGRYPLNRVYDPLGWCLGTACVTSKGRSATLVTKCLRTDPSCVTDYCIPQ
jgi:hypothetical protein